MRKTHVLLAAALLLPIFAGPTAAIEKKGPPTGVAVKNKPTRAPLSEPECTGLGGKVLSIAGACESTGKQCVTTDKNGVIHQACITKQ